jgi:hypothetical protein
MNRFVSGGSLLVCLVAPTACTTLGDAAPGYTSDERVGRTAQAIIGGTDDTTNAFSSALGGSWGRSTASSRRTTWT